MTFLHLLPMLMLYPYRNQCSCKLLHTDGVSSMTHTFSCIPAGLLSYFPIHTSVRESAAGNLRLLSITAGLLSTSRFLNIWWEPGWRAEGEVFALQGWKDTHTHTWIHVHSHTYKNTAAQGQLPKHTHSMGLLCSTTNLYVCVCALVHTVRGCAPTHKYTSTVYCHGLTIEHGCFMLFWVNRWTSTLQNIMKTWPMFGYIHKRRRESSFFVSWLQRPFSLNEILNLNHFYSLNSTGNLPIFMSNLFRIRGRKKKGEWLSKTLCDMSHNITLT